MLFSINLTPQNSIAGWLAPDNPTLTPKFKVDGDLASYILEADCMRTDIVNAHFHETGLVGFIFGEHNAPGITTSSEITVTELSQNRIIFRKTKSARIKNTRLFIFNNLPIPSKLMRQLLGEQFSVSYPAIDDFGIETALSLLGNDSMSSIFSEGRLSIQNHFPLLKKWGYITSALISEPFSELANRLLTVKALVESDRIGLLMALPPAFKSLSDCATKLDKLDATSIHALFASLTPEQKLAVADPLTRYLGCGQNEEPEPRHVSQALNRLSELDAVGLTSNFELFRDTLEPLIPGLDLGEGQFSGFKDAITLEELLRDSPQANRILRNDIRLYHYLEKSLSLSVGDNR